VRPFTLRDAPKDGNCIVPLPTPVIRRIVRRMTMLSFRVDERDAADAQRWAESLGVDRSQLLRDALRLHLVRLAAERDAERWVAQPLDDAEQSVAEIADWGPAEDWSDWADEAR
jgi:hypothetical protein